MITRMSPSGKTFVVLWTMASSVGFGLGWFLAVFLANPLYIGVVLGGAQALALMPRWRSALFWTAVSSVGWVVAVFALIASSGSGEGRAWTVYLGGVPFVTFPALALVQWSVVHNWFGGKSFVLWFGTVVCAFPVAALFAILFLLLANAGSSTFLTELPSALAPVFWLMGGIFGAFTGFALAVGAPELYDDLILKDRISFATLGLALSCLAAVLAHDALNAVLGYNLLAGEDAFSVYALRIAAYLALGFSIGRLRGVTLALFGSFVVASLDVYFEVNSQVAMETFSGAGNLFSGASPDFTVNFALPIAILTAFGALGTALSRARFLQPISTSRAYRVKL